MLKILLIEDNPIWRTAVTMQLDSLEFCDTSVCKTLDEAIHFLESNTIDLIVSDIQINDVTIFELFKIHPKYTETPFIFITVSEQIENYILSKQVKKSIFLIKPFHQLSLKSAIENLIHLKENKEEDLNYGINVKDKYGVPLFIKPHQIILIKSELAYCKIKTLNSQFVIKNNMKKICAELGPNILQIHKTYAVNKNNIIKVDLKSKIVLTTLGELPIGRLFKKDIANYLSSKQVI